MQPTSVTTAVDDGLAHFIQHVIGAYEGACVIVPSPLTIGALRALYGLADTTNPSTQRVLNAIHNERRRRMSAATRAERRS